MQAEIVVSFVDRISSIHGQIIACSVLNLQISDKHYTIMIPIKGLNGNTAVMETAWQYLDGSEFSQLITAFIPKKNIERRFLFLLDDLED